MVRAVIAIGVLAGAAWAGERIETPGRVDAVTVYRGQALVTRVVDVDAGPGLAEIVVGGLPPETVGSSVHAEASGGLEVRSVRYRVRPVQDDVRDEVRTLDGQIGALQRDLETNGSHRAVAQREGQLLDKLEQFVAPAAQVELTRGVLNADVLEKLARMICDRRAALAERELELSFEEMELTESIGLLQRQRQSIAGSSSRTMREAVVFVAAEGPGELRVRYLVNGATWSPSYTVRSGDGSARLEYFASIAQMSGEDWDDVRMTLSTATPALAAKAPSLQPLRLALAPPGQQQALLSMSERRQQVAERKSLLDSRRLSNVYKGEAGPLSQELIEMGLNAAATSEQLMDLVEATAGGAGEAPVSVDTGPTVTYALAGRTSLPSRSDQQLVQIVSSDLGGEFYRLAAPVLSRYVYREAELINTSGVVLLTGPASIYVEGQFVGNGDVPTVAKGEAFTVGLGIDPSLRTARELLKKEETVQGGNRVVELTYRLGVENFGDAEAAVRLLDRLPRIPGDQIRLTLTASTSDPALEEKTGFMRWDVTAPTRAAGAAPMELEYSFRLEYDKQMALTVLRPTDGGGQETWNWEDMDKAMIEGSG